MKHLRLALFLALLLGLAPAQAQSPNIPATTASVAITISTATTTRLIVGVASRQILITNINIIAGGSGAIQFISGTGATCGTGSTNLTGNYVLTAQQGFVMGVGVGAVLVAPIGHSFCAVTDSAVGMPGSVAYGIL